MNENEIVIKLTNVSKTFKIRESNTPLIKGLKYSIFRNKFREIEAVKNISFEIKKGEFFGIAGRNGSGKSTLMNIMCQVYQPDKGGRVEINGNFLKLSLGLGFNPELSARDNILLNASILGLTIREIKSEIKPIIEFAGLQKFVDTKVKYYSRGMKARLAFAVAIYSQSEILFLDEIFGGVGDDDFQAKSSKKFEEVILKEKTIVLISHNRDILREHADRLLYIDEGECKIIDQPDSVFKFYQQENKNRRRQYKLNYEER